MTVGIKKVKILSGYNRGEIGTVLETTSEGYDVEFFDKSRTFFFAEDVRPVSSNSGIYWSMAIISALLAGWMFATIPGLLFALASLILFIAGVIND